ncbi:MAG: TIGR03936 family radical SAM-associated protein [Spirochaetales bacterium]|uniref:TIGR03936 family radical SAM-associated protein n=1 Tax=Candidatus Thalassospirochaeta sargassi TaxID=3119039 RepID=A0AAJ1IEG2_9SPIO|nr:TIGR03936 family radical SAM-associated protein [Spirochaetales bacterium]
MKNIIPEKDLHGALLRVNMPGRYVGGEFGIIVKKKSDFSTALCFPDLYEIGMSNQAVKIIYEMINNETETACERVFNPAPDFEAVLREKKIPLYSLETGKSVKDHDLLAFTVGYELAATNMLAVLDLSGIPLLNDERGEDDPLVIAGGPSMTNPAPFGSFIDAVFIGEAEEIFTHIVKEMSDMKKKGAGRTEMLEYIHRSDYFWYKGRDKTVKKAVWKNFSSTKNKRKILVPSISSVQDHGVVEIMRGCPNGCRFCHAGIFYRPYREKEIDVILEEVESMIETCGYREVTLSSLSSGDYKYITELITILNKKYEDRKISFSFPSIRINSLTLPIISEISKVRKSGLTFAVETPELVRQRGLNKEAPKERIIEILKEAKKLGWNKAKFYFMVGLPFFENEEETDAIIDFLREVGRETKMQLNINVGTFIPKPHTPFQWSFQLDEKTAFERLIKIKRALPEKFFKVGFQSPFISFLESMISRGDERSGKLIIEAYKNGARLDAWDEYLKKQVWSDVIENADWDVEKEVCRKRDLEEVLPWDNILLGAGKGFFKTELEKAFHGELTGQCAALCNHNCGACNSENEVRINESLDISKYIGASKSCEADKKREIKLLFKFTKNGKAAFLSHINVMNVFERSFLRAGLELKYSQGFNPKPKLEFANPLTLGFESKQELAAVEMITGENTTNDDAAKVFKEKMNKSLPEGMSITDAKVIKAVASAETGKKVKSLMASYNGGEYILRCKNSEALDILQKVLNVEESVEYHIEDNRLVLLTRKNSRGNILNIFKMMKEKAGWEHPFDHIEVIRTKTCCAVLKEQEQAAMDYFSCYK